MSRFTDWLREHKKDVALAALMFLISTASFALGYLFAGETNRAPIVIERCSVLK
jgi:hypothetical protein